MPQHCSEGGFYYIEIFAASQDINESQITSLTGFCACVCTPTYCAEALPANEH